MLELKVKDKRIKNIVEYIKIYVKELENILYERADMNTWSKYNYNYCNHCAIGIAYMLSKKLNRKEYVIEASESYFTSSLIKLLRNRGKEANKSITGMEDVYNHAYVIIKKIKGGEYIIIDMQREPIWNNMIKNISEYEYKKGMFIEGEKEIRRSTYDIEECMAQVDFLTNTLGRDLFDEVIKRTNERSSNK